MSSYIYLECIEYNKSYKFANIVKTSIQMHNLGLIIKMIYVHDAYYAPGAHNK